MTEFHKKRPMRIDGPYYLRNPFDAEPGWGVSSINYNIQDLLALAGGNQ